MINIVVIGLGNIGQRHLQSIYELSDKYSIYGVDLNAQLIEDLKRKYPLGVFSTEIEALPEEIEVAVIATDARVRRSVFEHLTSHSVVKNIVFEKVLFQTIRDYEIVYKRLEELQIKAWVNCARREWTTYKTIKSELMEPENMYVTVSGGEWGMACNAIHFLDLIEYLSNEEICDISISGLEMGVIESKRKGFYEFFGCIDGMAGRCKNFSIICLKDSVLPIVVEITTNTRRYYIEEGNRVYRVSTKENRWKWIEDEFKMSFQSQMSARVIRSIIEEGTSNLPDYATSMRLHKKYIGVVQEFFALNGIHDDVCQIT